MGKNLFDTNRLIDFYKAKQKDIKGFTTILNIIEYPKSIDYFPNIKIIYPSLKDYETAISLSKELYAIGKNIPAIDILIASISYNLNLTIISQDKHFDYVKEVWDDFKLSQEYSPTSKTE